MRRHLHNQLDYNYLIITGVNFSPDDGSEGGYLMKRLMLILALTVLLALAIAPAALAQMEQEPVGSCPRGFELHHHHDMVGDEDHMHNHVGTSTDRNGDGWLCIRHATDENHVHTDNNLPLP